MHNVIPSGVEGLLLSIHFFHSHIMAILIYLQHLRWAIAGRPDLILPDAWAGKWRITMTSKNPETGSIAAVSKVTDTLGVGEPVGFSLLPDFVRCTWTGSDRVLEAACHARFSVNTCLADGSAHFNLARDAGSITGHGQVQLTSTGECGAFTGSSEDLIEIGGVRLGEEAEPEPFSPGVLAKLATSPDLVALITDRINAAAGGPPAADQDCDRGRWRRLINPRFRNARECHAFAADWRRHGEKKGGR